MKILIITGSPHRNGTSNTLAREFAKGAEEAGHEADIYDAARGNIHPCLGCDGCGMAETAYRKTTATRCSTAFAVRRVVFVTPVYYFGMSAQLKTVIDRFYARNGAITAKRMKAALIATAWNDDDTVMKGIEVTFGIIFDYLDFVNVGSVLAKGSGTVGMMPLKYRRQAYEPGRSL